MFSKLDVQVWGQSDALGRTFLIKDTSYSEAYWLRPPKKFLFHYLIWTWNIINVLMHLMKMNKIRTLDL